MAVKIEPLLNSVLLRVTGDVETVLTVPYADDDRFVLGLSDGTLLLGTYDETLECSWEVAREGAGIVRFDGNRVVIEWCTEWVMASVYDPNVIEPRVPHTLPLFPDLIGGPPDGFVSRGRTSADPDFCPKADSQLLSLRS